MHILVIGTKVVAWGEEPLDGDGVPFIVDDFPGEPELGMALHWDGSIWWQESDSFSAEEVLAAMFSAQPEMLEELPDDALAHMGPYMQEWQPDTAYIMGDKRSHLELPYRCLQPHTSNEAYPPNTAVSLWALILPGQGGTDIGEWVQPDSTNPYMKGDRVTHNDQVWESDYDNNVWEPGVFGWHVVEE